MRRVLILLALWTLFMILSPGIFITLPPPEQTYCVHGHPSGIKHRTIFHSGRSDPVSCLTHAILVGAIGYIIIAMAGGMTWIGAVPLSLAWCLTSFVCFPGLIITLPPATYYACSNTNPTRQNAVLMSGHSGIFSAIVQGAFAVLLLYCINFALPVGYRLKS